MMHHACSDDESIMHVPAAKNFPTTLFQRWEISQAWEWLWEEKSLGKPWESMPMERRLFL